MLRERTSGTLERLLTTPLGRLDLLLGYGLAFGLAAALQAVVTVTIATTVYHLDVAGSVWLVVLIAVVDAVLGVALGLLASAFARSEFQAVQFMPVVVLPQFFLCGLLVPVDQMAGWLQAISPRPAADLRRRGAAGGRAVHRGHRPRCGSTSRSWPVPPCSPSPSRRRPCGGGPAERRPEPPVGAGVPATPTPARRSWPPPGRRSPSAGSTARRSAASRPPPASTPHSCTTTSAARTSCSSPRWTRRPTRTSCCPRCSPPTATCWVPPSCAWRCACGTAPRATAGWPCSGPRSATSGRRSCCASSSSRRCCAASSRTLGFDPDERAARASLVASQLIGMVMVRYVLRLEPLASASAGVGGRGARPDGAALPHRGRRLPGP